MNVARAAILVHGPAAFDAVLRATWQAALLAVLVFLMQSLAGRRLSVRLRYNLWLLVLVRLALPVLPASSFSIYNLIAHRARPGAQGWGALSAAAIEGHLFARAAAARSEATGAEAIEHRHDQLDSSSGFDLAETAASQRPQVF